MEVIEQVLIWGFVGGFMTTLFGFWKISDRWKEKIIFSLSKKNTTGSLDLDNLVRISFVLVIMAIIWIPLFLIGSLIFDG